jgi:hypothetical protein
MRSCRQHVRDIYEDFKNRFHLILRAQRNGPSLEGDLGPFRFGRLGGGERTRLFQGARQTFVPVTIAGFGVDYFGPVSAIGQQPEP